jgi:diguanylate cyclase (GGDEF)-like protein
MKDMGVSSKLKFGRLSSGVLLASTLALILFAVWMISPFHAPGTVDMIGSLGLIVISLIVTGIGFNIAGNKTFAPGLRRAWIFFALGSLSSALAAMVWSYFSYILRTNPSTSIADLFYLLTFPLILSGIFSLPYAPLMRAQRWLMNVDMAIIVLAGGLFLWHFVLADLIKKDVNSLTALIAIADPVAVLLLLPGLLVLLQQTVRRVGRTIQLFLALATGLSILAGIFFTFQKTFNASNGLPAPGLVWLAALWAMLVAAIRQAGQTKVGQQQVESPAPWLGAGLPYIAVPGGVALAFFELGGIFRLDLKLYVTLLGVLAITLLVLVRQFLILQDNRRLHKELERLATTDPLTGIANRRFFEETLAGEIKRAQRYERPLSLLMIDIDNFKNYNEEHGHAMGDKLLQDCAHLFRALLRSSDLVARYGGDEFVVLLPEISVEQGRFVADKLSKIKMGALASEEEIAITIGCAALQQGMDAPGLLELADEDLYRQKPAEAHEQSPGPVLGVRIEKK